MESFEVDNEKFGENLGNFLNTCKDIILSSEKRKLKLTSRKNPILSRLEKYIKVFDRTQPEEHIYYFKQILSRKKTFILKGCERDNWLRSDNIVVHFGEETGRPVKDAKIHMSIIYNTALKLRDDIEEQLDGLPNVTESEEIYYPDYFALYLFKIFCELASGKDKDKISKHVEKLESEIGSGENVSQSNSNNGGSGDGINGIMDMATGLMKQMGVNLPNGQSMPSGKELTNAINGVMKNPEAKSLIGNVMKDFQECDNFGDVVGKLINNLPSSINNMQTPFNPQNDNSNTSESESAPNESATEASTIPEAGSTATETTETTDDYFEDEYAE